MSNYRPKDFGNSQITLTVDGGQHLRSPGDEPPKITPKAVESIFLDPVFDHKQQISQMGIDARTKVIQDVKNSMNSIKKDLSNARNYKQFFWTKDMGTYAFGTKKMRNKIELVSIQQSTGRSSRQDC